MHVKHPSPVRADHRRGEDPHEPRQAHDVDALPAEEPKQGGIVGFPRPVIAGVEEHPGHPAVRGPLERPGILPVRHHQDYLWADLRIIEESLEVRPRAGREHRHARVHRRPNLRALREGVKRSRRPAESRRMASERTTLESRWCEAHPDRQAVERCAECGRTACLSCAVPVRGRVLCTECTRRVVGEPVRAAAPSRGLGSRIPDVAAAILLGTALLATLVPWDRFGTLTGMLSAWRLRPDPWPLLAALMLLLATIAAGMVLLRRWPAILRYSAVAYTAVGAAAAVAVVVALLRAPDFTSHTPAPYVALIGAIAAAVVGAVRLRRES